MQEQQINAFQRKQLKQILGIKYPTKISNASLYKKTGEKHVTNTIREARWKLFGHILRRQCTIPENMDKEFNFLKRNKRGL